MIALIFTRANSMAEKKGLSGDRSDLKTPQPWRIRP
jgi:hypothetical protein